MKAAIVHDFNRPLAIEETPAPEPAAGQVVDGSAPAPRTVFLTAPVGAPVGA